MPGAVATDRSPGIGASGCPSRRCADPPLEWLHLQRRESDNESLLTVISAVLLVAYGAWSCFLASPDERLLFNPVLLSAAIVLAMIEYFWRRDRQLPIVDVGTLCVMITVIYIALPAIFYMKAGMKFTGRSDARLTIMGTTTAEVVDFLWFVTAYIAALATTYSLLRGRGMPGPRLAIDAGANAGWALLAIVVLAGIYQAAIEHHFGVNLNAGYQEILANMRANKVVVLPLLLGQITHNVLAIGRIGMLGIIAFVFARKSRPLALALTAWILIETWSTVSTMGARTNFAILIMAVVLSCHRLLRPIGPVAAAVSSVALLAGLLGYGVIRQGTSISDIWVAPNEFQVLMANGINVSWEKARGTIHDVPWQIIYNDFILMIPQQLLPFPKLDITEWYVQQLGWEKMASGLMFGVVAQSKLGFGLPEIIVRGAVLGAILALIHRQCVKHASSLTSFIIYLWLCTSIYYTYRASTFYIATWAVYRVIPFVLLFWLFSRTFRSRADVAPASSNADPPGTAIGAAVNTSKPPIRR